MIYLLALHHSEAFTKSIQIVDTADLINKENEINIVYLVIKMDKFIN